MTVAGLRRVNWVSVTTSASAARRPVAEAHGIGHRFPAVVRISLHTANALRAAGIPVVLHTEA